METKEVKVGELTFVVRSVDVRGDMLRQVRLMPKRQRYLNELIEDSTASVSDVTFREEICRYYPDIVAATVAIDGDHRHNHLIQWQYGLEKWEKWVTGEFEAGRYEEIYNLWDVATDLNPQWYPMPAIPEGEAEEEIAVLEQAEASLDITNPDRPKEPGEVEIVKAAESLEKKVRKAKKSGDFLG